MISFSTITKNVNGDIIINESLNSSFYNSGSRVSRKSTLDGGCVIISNGYSNSDLTFSIESLESTPSDIDKLKTIYEIENLLNLSTNIGFFSGVISNFSINNKILNISFLVKEKLSE